MFQGKYFDHNWRCVTVTRLFFGKYRKNFTIIPTPSFMATAIVRVRPDITLPGPQVYVLLQSYSLSPSELHLFPNIMSAKKYLIINHQVLQFYDRLHCRLVARILQTFFIGIALDEGRDLNRRFLWLSCSLITNNENSLLLTQPGECNQNRVKSRPAIVKFDRF